MDLLGAAISADATRTAGQYVRIWTPASEESSSMQLPQHSATGAETKTPHRRPVKRLDTLLPAGYSTSSAAYPPAGIGSGCSGASMLSTLLGSAGRGGWSAGMLVTPRTMRRWIGSTSITFISRFIVS